MASWVTAAELAAHLDLPPGTDVAEMDRWCGVAQEAIAARIGPRALQPPDDRLKAVALFQAAKLYRRKQTPEGVAGIGDFGVVRVVGLDPDIEYLLRPYLFDGFA